MLFLVAVAMAILGVALCIKGALVLPGGRQLKPLPARIAAGFLLSFLPLIVLLQITKEVFSIRYLDGLVLQLINWLLALSCLGTALVIIWMSSTTEKQTSEVLTKNTLKSPQSNTSVGAADNPFLVDHADEQAADDLADDPLLQHAQKKSKGQSPPSQGRGRPG